MPLPTLKQLQLDLRAGTLSPPEALDTVESSIAARDGQIGAYLSRDLEAARRAASKADVSLPLGGIPIAIKDLISVAGEPCTCASRMLANYRAPYDATVIRKLKKAGAIPFGRTNMDEFAMGSSTENSGLQVTRNPWDPGRIPGGSSGGSAAAVAGGIAIAALGSDTGGSIRQPAAHCGCVGLKPSYGRVSRFGLVAFASSLDQIGPMTQTVEDAALLLQAIAGPDPRDSTCLDRDVPDYATCLGGDLRGIRLGLPVEYFIDGIAPPVRAAVERAVETLRELGAEIIELSLPHTGPAIDVYYVNSAAEASANLARFDGVRYGHRTAKDTDLMAHYSKSRAEGFGSEVKRRIILGTYVLSSGYYDAFYLRAQKVRTLIRRDFENAFEKVDALISPTCPTPAFKLGEKTADPLQMYLADIFTIAANLAGICGISVPCGFAPPEEGGASLPIGLQLLGRPFEEETILRVAHAYEQATEWHRRTPPAPV